MATLNKDHWYDGFFYDKFIAPNQDMLFGQIKKIIKPNSKVIDVGCGTGRFSFYAADKCNSILGIDLSERNINRAQVNLLKSSLKNITFHHKNISEIISENNHRFDYAVVTYVIHEVEENQRVSLLNDIKKIADTIIIGDYLVPKPTGLLSWLNEIVEFVAGKDHYTNYKHYVAHGGVEVVVHQTGLKIIHEVHKKPYTSHIVVAVQQ
jgi:SAM-dependent methyltransferase